MLKTETIVAIETSKLSIHPFNEKIYMDQENAKFDQDIQVNGIRYPLRLNDKNQILDGARRYRRAIKYGMKEVPCIVRMYNTVEEEKEAIIMFNSYRCKTYREQYSEYQYLANKYKSQHKVGNPFKGTKPVGELRDRIAKETGISKSTMDSIKRVYDNESKVPMIAKALDNGTLAPYKAAIATIMVVEDGIDEKLVIRKMLKQTIADTLPIKKRPKSIEKEYLIKCPTCLDLLITNKQGVRLKQRKLTKPDL